MYATIFMIALSHLLKDFININHKLILLVNKID